MRWLTCLALIARSSARSGGRAMRNLWHWLGVLLIGCATEAGPVGECNPAAGSCYASKPCADVEMCEDHGQCEQVGNACVVTAAGCRASMLCKQFGACVARDGECVVVHDADCKASSWCQEYKHCCIYTQACAKCP